LIAKGATQPLKGKALYAHSVHGQDGLGGARIDQREGEEWWETYKGPAESLILEMASRYPGEITLVAVGPLTNLALGLKRDPPGMNHLKEIVTMGGAVRTRGNVTPLAEFNIFSDPLAARLVFESGLPVTLVPLDVTHRVSLNPQLMKEKVIPLDNRFSRFVTEVTGYDPNTMRFRGEEGLYLHDPLAVAEVIDPGLLKKERFSIDVETEEGDRYGETREVAKGPEIEVCLGVDSERFLDLFLSTLA
jgi:purine nucleosidase